MLPKLHTIGTFLQLVQSNESSNEGWGGACSFTNGHNGARITDKLRFPTLIIHLGRIFGDLYIFPISTIVAGKFKVGFSSVLHRTGVALSSHVPSLGR